MTLDERFDKWFREDFTPSYAYSGTDPNTLYGLAMGIWQRAYELGYMDGCKDSIKVPAVKDKEPDVDSWIKNPDRSGGMFTQQEIEDSGKWV